MHKYKLKRNAFQNIISFMQIFFSLIKVTHKAFFLRENTHTKHLLNIEIIYTKVTHTKHLALALPLLLQGFPSCPNCFHNQPLKTQSFFLISLSEFLTFSELLSTLIFGSIYSDLSLLWVIFILYTCCLTNSSNHVTNPKSTGKPSGNSRLNISLEMLTLSPWKTKPFKSLDFIYLLQMQRTTGSTQCNFLRVTPSLYV